MLMYGWVKPLLCVLAGILLLLLFSGEIRDTDVFWHLRTGQYIVQTHALPVPDPFSYLSTGSSYPGEEITRQFNLTHEWLSEVIMYLIYAATGFAGLVVSRVVLLMAFCGLAGYIAYYRTKAFTLSLAATLASAGMAFYFEQSRPFLATFVFLALTLAILETRRWLWFLPPIFLIWANCHSGFILGWVVLAAYCLRKDRKIWLIAVLSVLASALNPNGFRILQVLWFYRQSTIQTNNLEWQRPIFWTPTIYSFLLFGSLLVLILARRKAPLSDWFLYVAFAAISLLAVRNTIFLGLIGPILIASYLPKPRFTAPVALALGTVGLIAFDIVPAFAAHNTLAFRAATWQYPSGAASFIEAHHITARMFNNYEDGGYLIWRLWPSQRVFIDSRGLSEKAFTDYRRILDGATDLLDRYGIDVLVIEGFDYLSGQVYPMTNATKWPLVYADDKAVIFMRHPAAGLTPLDRPTALLDSLSAQCTEHLQHDPIHPNCALGMGEFYASLGDAQHAREWLSSVHDPEAEQISNSLALSELNNQAKGNPQSAEPLLRQAVALADRSLGPDHPDTAAALNNLATVLESKGNYTEAESLFRRSLAICEKKFGSTDPRTAMALDNLAGALEAQGNLTEAEALLRRSLAIAEHALPLNNPTTQTIRDDLEALLKAIREHAPPQSPR